MPARGFITCCDKIPAPEMAESVKLYIEKGGRLVDTSPGSGYEKAVGRAIQESAVPRKKLWISSKVDTDKWHAHMGSPKDWTIAQVEQSLSNLGLEYLDSMVLHYGPAQVRLHAPQPGDVRLWNTIRTIGPSEHVDMWKGLIEAKKKGFVRNIGVSQSSRREIEHLIMESGESPVIVQAWYHPWVPVEQQNFIEWAKSRGMAVQSYGMMSPFKMEPGQHEDTNLYYKSAKDVALRHSVTPGQVALHWIRSQGNGFVTRFNPMFVEEDLECHDFVFGYQDYLLFSSASGWTCDLTRDKYKQFMPGCMP
jgi:diketogulonate reductase-like aldo/keto reductase